MLENDTNLSLLTHCDSTSTLDLSLLGDDSPKRVLYQRMDKTPPKSEIPTKIIRTESPKKSERGSVETFIQSEEVFIVQIKDSGVLSSLLSRLGEKEKASLFTSPRFLTLNDLPFGSKTITMTNKRMSNISSSSSSNYFADSSSSEGSKKDRISLCPDSSISSHYIVGKLPCIPSLTQDPKFESSKESPKTFSVLESAQVCTPFQEEKYSQEKSFVVGDQVFAKWGSLTYRSTRYYPAIVLSQLSSTNYKVRFYDDDVEKIVKYEDLIPAKALKPQHSISVTLNEGESIYNTATLLTTPLIHSKNGGIEYSVEFTEIEGIPQEQSSIVSHTRVHLDVEQAAKIYKDLKKVVSTPSKNGSNLSLDNILTSKRKIKKVEDENFIKTPTRRRGGPHVQSSSAYEDSSDSESLRHKGHTADQIFKDMVFILTHSGEPSPDPCSEPYQDSRYTFNKKNLTFLLESHGGKTLKQFPGETGAKVSASLSSHLIVLSDHYSTTLNYLTGIAFGCVLLHYEWIHHSCEEKKRLSFKDYLLPIGWSEHQNCVLYQSLASLHPQRLLFQNNHLLFAFLDRDLYRDWRLIALRCGATVSYRSSGKIDRNLKYIDVIIINEKDPLTSIQSDGESKKIPIVSTKWIIQSLINSKKVPFII